MKKIGRCVECHKETARAGARRRHQERKTRLLAHYGGVCVRCGMDDPDVLTLDHIEQDGANHRKTTGTKGASAFYCWVEKNRCPNDLRILCFNCNIKVWLIHQRAKRED